MVSALCFVHGILGGVLCLLFFVVGDNNAYRNHYQSNASNCLWTEMLVKEKCAQNYSCERLQGSKDGCQCRSDAPYGLYTGEV